MLLYYLKSSTKIIKRHIGFSFLNIAGLTLGISSCLLIILYVNFELGFDKFHEKESSIYRVVMKQPGNLVVGSSSDWWVVSPYILKPTWEAELPEIKMACRETKRRWTFQLKDQYVVEEVMVTDPEFFEMFTFPLKMGNAKEVFSQPYSMVISQKMAEKYFGDDDPMGQALTLNNGTTFHITGVLEKIPENSHLKFDFLYSFQTHELISGGSLISQNWLNNGYRTYLILHDEVNLLDLDAKLKKYDVDGFNGKSWSFHLQPLNDIHFNRQIAGTGDKNKLFIFISVGAFILLIAGINYMNLHLAHYRSRTKNIGIRRITGATRAQLLLQLFSESFLLVLVSYFISILVVASILPVFNNFIGEQLEFISLWKFNVLVSGLGIVLMVALIAGVYPAFYLSGLQVTNGIKGEVEKISTKGKLLRKSIIVVQFSIAIILVIGTITVYKQLKYMSGKSLGYEKEHILYFGLNGIWYQDQDGQWKNRTETLKQELIKNPNIIMASASTGIPSNLGWSNIPIWEGRLEGEKPFFYRLKVDADFLELYGMEMALGRKFSTHRPGDIGKAYVLNEAAVKSLGFNTPIGTGFGFDEKMGTVVGVVKDFHFETLHKPITPLGIGLAENTNNFNFISVKIANHHIPETIGYIEDTWHNLTNNAAFNYSFLDERLDLLYKKDQQLAESLNYFSLMALFISCLGIFGIMSYAIKERTKELGIRKVLGATFLNLLNLLSKDVIIILGLAVVAGSILGWYAGGAWLKNFAYRIDVGLDTLILSFIITIIITLIPVSLSLRKAFIKNPVDTLRTE